MKHVIPWFTKASLAWCLLPFQLLALSEGSAAQINVTVRHVSPTIIKTGQLVHVKVTVAACFGKKNLYEDERANVVSDVAVDIKLLGGGFFVSGTPEQGALIVDAAHEGVWKIGTLAVGQTADLDLFYRSGLQENILVTKARAESARTVHDTLRLYVNEGAIAHSLTFEATQNVFTEIPLSTIAEFDPPAVAKIKQQPSHGSMLIRQNKSDDPVLVYRSDDNFVGVDSFAYQVSDKDGSVSNVGTISLAVAELPKPELQPTVAAQERQVEQAGCPTCGDLPCVVCPGNGVICQDEKFTICIDCPCAHVTITRPPDNGMVELVLNKKIIYTPNPGFFGMDSFVYEVCFKDNCISAQVDIEVLENCIAKQLKALKERSRIVQENEVRAMGDPGPIAEDDCVVICQGQPIEIPVLANDTFCPPIVLTIAEEPASGEAVAVVNNTNPPTITYTPNPTFSGPDSFVYQLCDVTSMCDTASVCVTVLASPVVTNTTSTTCKNNAININVFVTPPPPMTMTIISAGPSNGTAIVNANNTVTYTPDAGFTGVDQFVVQASTGPCCVDNAVVTVNVNGAADDQAVTCIQTPVTIDVLANDTFTPPVMVAITTPPANGVAVVNANNSITYTPNANFIGNDAFVYQLSDAAGCVTMATVSVSVAPIPPPIAMPDFAQTGQFTPVVIDVLANDKNIGPTDPVTVISQPASGKAVATVNPDRTITYMVTDTTFTGIDQFIYEVCGPTCCDSAPVMVTVNKQPLAVNDKAYTCENNAQTVDVLANDMNLQNPVVTIQTPPNNGAAFVTPNNEITYIPDNSFSGVDSLVYRVTNQSGSTGTATLTIVVTMAPMGNPDGPIIVPQGGPTMINVLANDVFVPPAELTVLTQPANGTAVVNPGMMGMMPSITYTPNQGFLGMDSFTYQLSDATGCSSEPTVVTVLVQAILLTQPGCTAVVNNATSLIDLNANIINATPPAVCTIVMPTMNGTLVPNGNCTFLYTPNTGFRGTDAFMYQVTDGTGATSQAQFTIVVGPQDGFVNALQSAFCSTCVVPIPSD